MCSRFPLTDGTAALSDRTTSGVPRVSLCRGCCCGTSTKRPDIDHPAQTERLTELAATGRVRWRETACLGPCAEANVMVLHPSPRARAVGARPVWLGGVGDDDLEVVLAWLLDGGPGEAPIPGSLRSRRLPAYGPNDSAS